MLLNKLAVCGCCNHLLLESLDTFDDWAQPVVWIFHSQVVRQVQPRQARDEHRHGRETVCNAQIRFQLEPVMEFAQKLKSKGVERARPDVRRAFDSSAAE